MHRQADLQKQLNAPQTCSYCELTGVHPNGRFCPAYGKRYYNCRNKHVNERYVKYRHKQQHSMWIKHLTKEVAETEEDSDDSSDEEFEARLVEHMTMWNHLGRINYFDEQEGLQRRITQEDTRVKLVENNFSGRPGNTEQTKKQYNNIAELEHIKVITQELENIRVELAESKAERSILREKVSKQETELNKYQVKINECCSIMQQQKKEIDKLKQKTDN